MKTSKLVKTLYFDNPARWGYRDELSDLWSVDDMYDNVVSRTEINVPHYILVQSGMTRHYIAYKNAVIRGMTAWYDN